MTWRVISVEDWAEIRRLYLAERLSIKAIARRLGLSRNTVRAAVRSVQPPKYVRAAKGSIVDAVEPRIREVLKEFPEMPATVIAGKHSGLKWSWRCPGVAGDGVVDGGHDVDAVLAGGGDVAAYA